MKFILRTRRARYGSPCNDSTLTIRILMNQSAFPNVILMDRMKTNELLLRWLK